MSNDRDDYAARLADIDRKLEQNCKTMEENLRNFMTANITNSIKQAVQNLIMDNLVEASTTKILSKITKSDRMDALVDNIVHQENAQLKALSLKVS